MIQTKSIKRNIKTFLTLTAIAAVGAFSVSPSTPASAALTPGCYITGSGSYEKVNCPDADLSRAVTQFSKCFVATGSSQGVGAFAEQDCATLNNPGSGGTGGTGGSGSAQDTDVNPLGDFEAQTGDVVTSGVSICGKGGDNNRNQVEVAFDFGCRGPSYAGGDLNPIVDILFALFRALSLGVGFVVIGSIIVAGIQYSTARGNPQATQAAIKRITSAVGALMLYIFIFALANFLIPGGLFK